MWDLSCPTRDRTHNPYIGSMESQPLGHQGSPNVSFLDHQNNVAIQSRSIITLHFYFLYNSSITFFCFIIYVYLFASLFMWKKWQPTEVFLPEKFYGQKSPLGYSPWDCKELDTTELLSTSICCIFLHTPSMGPQSKSSRNCCWMSVEWVQGLWLLGVENMKYAKVIISLLSLLPLHDWGSLLSNLNTNMSQNPFLFNRPWQPFFVGFINHSEGCLISPL